VLCGVVLVAQFLSSSLWEFGFEDRGLSFLGNSEFRLNLAEVVFETAVAVVICGATLTVMKRLGGPANLPEALPSDPNSRALFRHSPDVILVLQAGTIVSANFAAASVLGAEEPAHLVGRPVTEFLRPRFLAPDEKRLSDIRDDDAVVSLMEERCKRFDGSAIDLEVWGGPCRWEGSTAIQLFARDITWRKHA
jgi:PAS domain S-box-containing protein